MRRTDLLLAIALIMGSGACSQPGSAASSNAVDAVAAQTPTVPAVVQGKAIKMSTSKPCGATMRERTTCMIELILEDVRLNYKEADGGGIGDIKGHSSTSYTVSLPQEERVDLITYEFEVKDGAVTMISKTPGTGA